MWGAMNQLGDKCPLDDRYLNRVSEPDSDARLRRRAWFRLPHGNHQPQGSLDAITSQGKAVSGLTNDVRPAGGRPVRSLAIYLGAFAALAGCASGAGNSGLTGAAAATEKPI